MRALALLALLTMGPALKRSEAHASGPALKRSEPHASGPAAAQEPVLHKARVVLQTSKGDIVLALYPEVAPRHVEHFLKLVEAKVYDGTRFQFVHRGFLLQHAGNVDRLRLYTKEQEGLASIRLPAEFSALHHVRGTLSMARMPDDPDSATSVFAILLGDAPHMDGKYTIFGRVERGHDALAALEAVPVRTGGIPTVPLNLHRAVVEGDNPHATLIVAGALIVAGLAAFLLSGRLLPRYAGPIGLSVVIAGFFIGFVDATPRVIEARESRPILALAVFVSLLALFKLMNRFESPRT
jgi:cyclophilin family peptidyl-prolyl cis-trans isomerase